jgi:DegV family protein with EDD domain
MAYKLIADSCCNLTAKEIAECDLTILPLTYYVDGESHINDPLDSKTDLTAFYHSMRDGKVVSTSLVNLADAQDVIVGFLEQGYDVLYLGFSSALSGTFEGVNGAFNTLRSEYPNQKLIAVDTLAAAGGQGLLTYVAAQKKKNGAEIEELAKWVEENRLRFVHWFTVDDLVYLFRGGRVSKTSAWAGSLLNIKPVLHVDDEGRLIPVEKVRGRKKSLDACIKSMKANGFNKDEGYPVFINHGDCLEDALYVRDKVIELYGDLDITITELDPVIGAHSGPGTIALYFVGSHR